MYSRFSAHSLLTACPDAAVVLLLAVYLLAYSLLRFGLEFLRGDAYRGFVLGLSVSQAIALLSMVLAAVLLIRLRKRNTVCPAHNSARNGQAEC